MANPLSDILGFFRGAPGGVAHGIAPAAPQLTAQQAAANAIASHQAKPGMSAGQIASQVGAQPTAGKSWWEMSHPAGSGPQGQTIQSLLAAILGGQQGAIPQGYANLFTNVVGPMQQQQAAEFSKQLAAVGGGAPHIGGVDKQTQDAIAKAYGETGAQLNALNQAAQTGTGLGALGEQQFVTGPLANTQKLIQSLQAALSYLPYVQATTGASPLTQAIEQMLGLGGGAIQPVGASTSQTAPSISG